MKKSTSVVLILLLVGVAGFGGWWFSTRIQRAGYTYRYGDSAERLAALTLLIDNIQDNDAFLAIIEGFTFRDCCDPDPEILVGLSRAFIKRKPPIDSIGFVPAVIDLQIRGQYPETKNWIDDYENEPEVTKVLLQKLTTKGEQEESPGAHDNLDNELGARPKNSVTFDLVLEHWRNVPTPSMLAFIETFEPSLVESRLRAKAKSPAEGEDEWHLLVCQMGRCTRKDLSLVIDWSRRSAQQFLTTTRYSELRGDAAYRTDDAEQDHSKAFSEGPENAWRRVSMIGGGLWAQRKALVSIGAAAVPTVLDIYDEPSRAMWSFAALTLIELDHNVLIKRLAADIKRNDESAAKALIVLQAMPIGDKAADRLFLEALSSRNPALSNFALASLPLRMKQQELVDGVLVFVSDRKRFYQDEVETYEVALKSAGPGTGTYVANTINQLLDSIHDPRLLPWIQKVLAIHVLRDVGTDAELPVLQRLRRDPGGYVWIESTFDRETKQEQETRRNISFVAASDQAIDAIKGR